MPLEETFFAARFSQLRDRFGVSWSIIHERPIAQQDLLARSSRRRARPVGANWGERSGRPGCCGHSNLSPVHQSEPKLMKQGLESGVGPQVIELGIDTKKNQGIGTVCHGLLEPGDRLIGITHR